MRAYNDLYKEARNEIYETNNFVKGKYWHNGVKLVEKKVVYAGNKKFGGVMLFELGSDLKPNTKLSLLRAVTRRRKQILATRKAYATEQEEEGAQNVKDGDDEKLEKSEL
eukprot:CAMPEP_0181291692 /NCGR_PEP_ID=MMETSP1101-20121128/2106_1 /TAXON_ID=46948 /ORGANISM="Rhodomonas abbreviata, Strain Caron Lab Isolate" /LENGTH=109 /DNA_ID=CAMNT_0023396107 /DNA_START=160 /DNA_END=489 /DNA_ORIENTATION=+